MWTLSNTPSPSFFLSFCLSLLFQQVRYIFFLYVALSSSAAVFILLHHTPNKDPGIELILVIDSSLGRTLFREYDH
jgi:hypothetical protein